MTDDPILDAVRLHWAWTGMNAEKILLVSPFGHLLIRDAMGHVWHLDMELRSLDRVARSDDQLVAYMDDPAVRQVWEAGNWVDAARARLGEPPVGHCYTFKAPALLSGDFSLDHLTTLPVAELVAFVGDVERQTRDLPNGAKFELKVTE